jgi:ribosomal protein S18 acetylase RimI-like enzyme
MPISTGTDFTPKIRRLYPADTDQIFDVHERVRSASLRGALDPRAFDEFTGMLADPRTAAVGAEAGSRLVGYAISIVPRVRSTAARSFLARFGADGERFAESRGIAVLPDFQRCGVATALLRRQQVILHSQEVKHSFNIILQRNQTGIAARLANGAMLVGQVADRYGAPCFLAYSGPLCAHFDPAAASVVPLTDICEQKRLFDLSHAVLSCRPDVDSRESAFALVFSPECRQIQAIVSRF